jgi:predicted transposase YbfD/YdcC
MHSTTNGRAVTHEAVWAENGEQIRSLYQVLQSVPDGRCMRGRRYEAALVLTLLLVAKLAGEQTMAGIAEWVRQRKELVGQWLPLKRVPCANTYRYVCAHIDAQALLHAAVSVLETGHAAHVLGTAPLLPDGTNPLPAPLPAPLRHLACDGKQLRGSHRRTATGVQAAQGLLGIYDTHSEQMVALLPIAGKGFEPKAFRTWLMQQTASGAVAGCLLTADALHTQTAVCKAIVKADADYLLVVKRNQRSLREDITYLFSQAPNFWFPERQARQTNAGHGRIETRTLRASDELNVYLVDRWPGVQQVFQVERTVKRHSRQGDKTSVEVVYGLTSLPASRASPEQLLAWLRAHWRIENRNHWRRDATLGEDRLQLACKPAALVMATLNCLILTLFNRLGIKNCRQAMRTYNAHPEQALALLCQPF